jgi:hypothetical protein
VSWGYPRPIDYKRQIGETQPEPLATADLDELAACRVVTVRRSRRERPPDLTVAPVRDDGYRAVRRFGDRLPGPQRESEYLLPLDLDVQHDAEPDSDPITRPLQTPNRPPVPNEDVTHLPLTLDTLAPLTVPHDRASSSYGVASSSAANTARASGGGTALPTCRNFSVIVPRHG